VSIGGFSVSVAVCVAECVAIVQGVFEYGGQTYDLMPHPEGASASGCAKLVKLVLKQNEPCGAEQVSCCNPEVVVLTLLAVIL